MAGIVALYYLGFGGGFKGADGMAGYEFTIEVGASDREWFALRDRLSYNYPPLCMSVTTFIPKGPMDKDSIRIAMILWASSIFKNCPSYNLVKNELEEMKTDYIDFDCNRNVPLHFYTLLEESRSISLPEDVFIYASPLYTATMDNPYPWEYKD